MIIALFWPWLLSGQEMAVKLVMEGLIKIPMLNEAENIRNIVESDSTREQLTGFIQT